MFKPLMSLFFFCTNLLFSWFVYKGVFIYRFTVFVCVLGMSMYMWMSVCVDMWKFFLFRLTLCLPRLLLGIFELIRFVLSPTHVYFTSVDHVKYVCAHDFTGCLPLVVSSRYCFSPHGFFFPLSLFYSSMVSCKQLM